FPYTSQCDWAGLAELSGHRTWINGELDLRVIGHELGHNFGLHHASSEACVATAGRPVQISVTCTHDAYGDPTDNMGPVAIGTLHLTAWPKLHAGRLGDTGSQALTDPGTYAVAPLELQGTLPIGLRIPRPGRSDSLWIDFRQPSGSFDTSSPSDPAVNGV